MILKFNEKVEENLKLMVFFHLSRSCHYFTKPAGFDEKSRTAVQCITLRYRISRCNVISYHCHVNVTFQLSENRKKKEGEEEEEEENIVYKLKVELLFYHNDKVSLE